MADILSELYNSCDPNRPATSEQYVDLSAVRGDNAFARTISSALQLTAAGANVQQTYLRAPFSGHIGSGKSSELRHLRDNLSINNATGFRFLPVLMDGIEYLDPYDTDIEDILVAILTELAEQVRERTEIDVRETYLEKRLNEIRETLVSDVAIPESEVNAGWLKAKLRLTRQSSEDRTRIRNALRPKLPTFLAEINATFADVRRKLRSARAKDGGPPYNDFVFIADSLDRIQRSSGETPQDPLHRRLFLEGGTELAKLEAHAIWTVPLALVRSAPGELQAAFGRAPYVLPMVKTEKRGAEHQKFDVGLKRLKQLVAKRIAKYEIDDAVTHNAMGWMIQQSGGDVRCLMTYIQTACQYVDKAPIIQDAAVRATNQTAATFAPAIGKSHWQKLAELELSIDQQADNRDAEVMEMLRQTWILEYVNGSGDGDVTPWYAVHPVIRRLSQFKLAVEIEKKANIATVDTTPHEAP